MDKHVIESLSEHLDGNLSAEATAEVEAHLQSCSQCAQVRDELLSLREAAADLPDWGPERDLWPGILAQMSGSAEGGAHEGDVIDLQLRISDGAAAGASRRRRHVRLTIPQLIAASVALIFFSGAGALTLRPAGSAGVVALAPGLQRPVAQLVSDQGERARFDDEVAALEALLEGHRAELAENTLRILEKNLEIIDRAIDESIRALERDPSSLFLQGHLAEALARKVGYLREAAQVVEAAA